MRIMDASYPGETNQTYQPLFDPEKQGLRIQKKQKIYPISSM